LNIEREPYFSIKPKPLKLVWTGLKLIANYFNNSCYISIHEMVKSFSPEQKLILIYKIA